jgi:hypothetical protein
MIPPYLSSQEPTFFKIASRSKSPKKGNSHKNPGDRHFRESKELQEHIRSGGNVGRILCDDLIAIDVDSRRVRDHLESWPDTLVIESGGDDFGYHFYFRCSDWEFNQKELTEDSRNFGSIRSGNSYCLVPPSLHDETGNRYLVSNPTDPAEIDKSRLSSLLEKFSSTASTGGARRGGVGERKGTQEPLPEEYPNQPAEWTTLKKWLSANGFLKKLRRSSGDRSSREFLLAKCLAEGGFSVDSISRALDRLPQDSKWHEEGTSYQDLTVQKAVEAACDDPYVDFESTADMDRDRSERRKTEESGEGRTLRGGEYEMTDFKETEEAIAQESNAEGATAVKAVKVEGNDDGDTFEFVSVRRGSLRERQTVDGDNALIIDIDDTDGSTVGSPDDLDTIIEALEALSEKIDD